MVLQKRFLYTLTLLLVSCATTALSERYFERREGNPNLIVFVHGIVGSADGTWHNSKTGKNWPSIVSEDPLFSGTDILVYNYPSSLVEQKFSMEGLTQRMGIEFRSNEISISDYEKITFIAHSMGGIIVRNYILENPEIVPKIDALYLFSTPMNGSSLANILSLARRTPLVKNLSIPKDGEGFLSDLRRSWREKRLSKEFDTFCAFESAPVLRTVRVVAELSAELLCDSGFVEIPEDHFSMVKPVSKQSYSHFVLSDWYSKSFPSAREALKQAESEREILIARCKADRLGPIVNQTIEEELQVLGFNYSWTRTLPEDWKDTYKRLLWSDTEPKVLLIHLSCFQEGPNSIPSYVERTQDFRLFLSSLADTKATVIVYSRAFAARNDPKFFEHHLPQSLRDRYSENGRLIAFPIESVSRFSENKNSRMALRQLIQSAMNE
ncbi:MAG: hypothetical protein WA790_06315 [Sulfitobacter sp.]